MQKLFLNLSPLVHLDVPSCFYLFVYTAVLPLVQPAVTARDLRQPPAAALQVPKLRPRGGPADRELAPDVQVSVAGAVRLPRCVHYGP